MPGMASGRFPARSSDNEESTVGASSSNGYSNGIKQDGESSVERPVSPQKTGGRDRTLSTPDVKPIAPTSSGSWQADRPSSVASRYRDEELISAQRTGSRDRTLSTPSYDFKPPMSPPAFRNSISSRYTEPTKERPASPQKLSIRERTLSTPKALISVSPTSDDESAKGRRPASGTSNTSYDTLSSKPSSPPQHSPITTPALAGPIRPQPRTSLGPQISTSPTPSPAFLKPPPQKEPTPSLSRLKGRGFVQNMVKASMQMETSSPSSSHPSTPEKLGPGARKATVLDRWQHQGSVSPPPTSPPASPKPIALRKTRTVDSPVPATSPEPVKHELSPKPSPKPKALKSSVSFSSMTETIPPEPKKPEPAPKPKALKSSVSFSNLSGNDRSKAPKQPSVGNPGLGSATTLVVFKPDSDVAPFVDVSELGVKHTSTSLPTRSISAPSGKPRIHVR